jgi:mannose-binding lectin 2
LTSKSFQIDIEYKIDGSSTHLFGDGMAIWLTTRRAEVGPVFGFIDQWEGLGLIIDTFANGQHSYSFPRIQAIKGDGVTKYQHDTDGAAQELGACSTAARRTPVTSKIRIIYIEKRFLEVKIQNKAWDEWEPCIFIEKYQLPDSPFLGFTALTGDVSDAHDIIAVTTSHVTLAPPAKKEKVRSSSGGFLTSFLKFLGFGVLCVLAFAGWRTYTARSRSRSSWSNKRF